MKEMKPKKNFQQVTANFPKDPEALFEGLRSTSSDAILYLHGKVKRHIDIKRYVFGVSAEDAEELANDTVFLMIKKIKDGSYSFQGFSPLSFTLVIADNLMRNFNRKKKTNHLHIDDVVIRDEFDVEDYLQQKEIELRLKKELDKMDEGSRQVISLKYFDGMKDEEVIEKKLTPYSTTDSLKSKRYLVMRKLAKIFQGQQEMIYA